MIKIQGTLIKTPSELKVGRFDLTKSNRTASGKMTMELIATKKRVDMTWKMITDSELQSIIDTITNNKPFFTLEYPDAGGPTTITCYAGDISTSLWHEKNGVRYWEEVSIPFIEQ
jgi:CO dehydrogenase/acetyl-CoA synthase alpha subunit